MFSSFYNTELRIDDEIGRIRALNRYQLSHKTKDDDPLFADLVAIAQELGNTQTAYISLIDEDKLWFATGFGTDDDTHFVDRGVALCNTTIAHADGIVILDASKDERFCDNPLVTAENGVRFYAGAPIITPDGYALGALALSDPEPRENFAYGFVLKMLARQAAALLELRRNLLHQKEAANLAADQRDRLWNISLDIMLIIRDDGVIVSGNPAWESNFGPINSDNPPNIASYLEEDAQELLMLDNGQKTVHLERIMTRNDGEKIYASWNFAREDNLIYGVARDITRARETEMRLHKAQKLESLGQLTGGIAHDFNNLLTIILGNMDIAHHRLEKGQTDRAKVALHNAHDGASRAANLTQRLLAFARRQPLSPSLINLAQFITELLPLAKQALNERYQFQVSCADNLHPLEIDPSQLENAILNLIVNARDAMEDGGKIDLTIQNQYVDRKIPGVLAQQSANGHYVKICVCDAGIGMSDDTVKRLLEPFFTTKGMGQGTGLGLPQVHGFVVQSGGFLSINTELGRGTIVSIWLPAADDDDIDDMEGEGKVTSTDEQKLSAIKTNKDELKKAIILVVEDNDEVRKHVANILQEAGLTIVTAQNGEEACTLMDNGEFAPHLLLSDVMMPKMDGYALARWVKGHLPTIPILLMSGYAGEEIPEDSPHNILINKPFSSEQLVDVVLSSLDKSGFFG